MSRLPIVCIPVLCCLCGPLVPRVPAGNNVSLPRFPSVSPDGKTVVFSWRGDLWKVPTAGGEARRLTSHKADDLQSAFSRDGRQIAFMSNRTGYFNIHLMDADGANLRHLLATDRLVALWSFAIDDGQPVVTFSGRLEHHEYPGSRSYVIGLGGGEPRRLFDAFGSTPSISPDGSKILFTRGAATWSRRGYRGPDARDVWLYDRATKTYRQLTTWNGNDGRAKWIDNRWFVFASDRQDNTVNLYRLSIDQPESQARKLTHFTATDVEDFDISADGSTLVFALWDRLFRLDLARPEEGPAAIDIQAPEDAGDRIELKSVDRTVSEAALSPDGKALAVVAYGQVYVRGTEAKSPARRVTEPPARHGGIAWSPDGQTLYFHGDATGVEAIYAASVRLTRSELKQRFEESTHPPATKPVDPTDTIMSVPPS
ncbi:MAG: peptidase S41, partial [Phycisphaerae bacterium]|nr:peptidase S41 [Phycisphaerae bacterium]MDW8261780.1 hypothetical protein [Phycisphaerales bacterium]